MKELIGNCVRCNKAVYCRDGFFDGVHHKGKLFCMDCNEKVKLEESMNR
ncbi:hypothetical protein SAMN05216244_0813 [Sediminibacillus halophilus]|uniref:Uncharacterized protein n=1 Tax=Sediminibacillus halophilus TaxID=482461 RepID=A0A1G9N1K8_9BACI|nr:hypothetical protein SAMN05216244_0813 [Sediminibacillus halophilus]